MAPEMLCFLASKESGTASGGSRLC